MEVALKMTDDELIALYKHMSAEYNNLDDKLKNLLFKLEQTVFDSLTVDQIAQLKTL